MPQCTPGWGSGDPPTGGRGVGAKEPDARAHRFAEEEALELVAASGLGTRLGEHLHASAITFSPKVSAIMMMVVTIVMLGRGHHRIDEGGFERVDGQSCKASDE
jgi:hypothetical protein